MRELELIRLTLDKSLPQVGALLDNSQPLVLTLELPWRDNAKKVSCIPVGSYLCKRRPSTKTRNQDTFEVCDVPNRDAILFHYGNFVTDTEGCILTGLGLWPSYPTTAISESVKAWQRFMQVLVGETEFRLFIRTAQ